MEKELITIVVPVYKVEKYLNRCVNSIVNQTYRNLEIILVDDGSPDKCPEMCDKWAEKDNRIKVVHKKNEGLGMARNTGIDHATGEYICFFDSDDYVALDTIEKCLCSAQKYNSDIVMFGMNSVNSSGKIISSDIPNTDKEFYCDSEITAYILPNMIAADPRTGRKSGLNMSSSGRMYRYSIIESNHWRFVSEREYISEDFYSLLVLYHYVKSVSVIKEAFYFYCYNVTSLTHSFREDRFEKICYCHAEMLKVCNQYGYSAEVKSCLDSQFLGNVIGSMKLIVSSDALFNEKIKQLSLITDDKYLNNVLHNMDIRNETIARRIIIMMLKHKMCYVVYMLIKAKS